MTIQKVDLLQELVLIPSGTANISGVNAVQFLVQKKLDSLGFKTSMTANPINENHSGLLLQGVFGDPGSSPLITLVTHADTVYETESQFEGFRQSSNRKTATGPGTIDDKGGIVIALSALEDLIKENGSAPIRFICSPSEEIGSPGFHQIFKKYSKDSWMILGLEPSMPDGSIIESRRGNRWYHIKTEGKEAHAGRAHKEGVNAGHELAIKLDRLQRLTDYGKNITVSLGWLSGGQNKYNIVCGNAEAKIDTRFPDFKQRDKLHLKIEKILKTNYVRSHLTREKVKTHFTVADDCPPFSTSLVSKPFLNEYLKILKSIEKRRIKSIKSGGSADVNYMSREGLICLDGLGPTGGELHSNKEFITLESLETRTKALAQFLKYAISHRK